MMRPFQNRVDPLGAIHAVGARGMMLGNRGGRFHRDDGTLGKRRWASAHWIACELHYKGMHHEAMGAGYTSLFFLDEVTALAAGHRPCFFCRRAEAKRFLGDQRVGPFDEALHRERLGPRRETDVAMLPGGAMIAVGDGAPFAVKGDRLLPWSFAGYAAPVPRLSIPRATLLTPPLIVAILASGYQPRWHESAQAGDGT
jgi:hypothetical protein